MEGRKRREEERKEGREEKEQENKRERRNKNRTIFEIKYRTIVDDCLFTCFISGRKARVLCVLAEHCTTDLYPKPSVTELLVNLRINQWIYISMNFLLYYGNKRE